MVFTSFYPYRRASLLDALARSARHLGEGFAREKRVKTFLGNGISLFGALRIRATFGATAGL